MRLRRILIVVFLVLAAALAVSYYPPVRLSALVLAGRSPSCPLRQAVLAVDNERRQEQIKDRILRASSLLEKDPSGYRLYDTPKGRYWIPEGSHFVLPFNLAEQERRIYGQGAHFVQPGDIVLDCGANVGVFTREALQAGAKRVIAIEPAPENIECLRRNFAAEISSGRVVVYPKGVWDKDDFLELHIDHHNSAADSFVIQREGAQRGVKVPLTTIDKMRAELGIERVDFIKMDIEGAEVRAIDGARETIGRFHPRMSISVYHAPDHPESAPRAARRAWPGYSIECGPCAVANAHIRPDILYFR